MAKDSIELALSILRAEEANLSPEQRKQLAELSKVGEDVRESVTYTLETGEKWELSPEQVNEFLGKLKTRFEAPENDTLHKMFDFADVEKSLRAAPEKMFGLFKMEKTGGEPQVIGLNGDEFIFEDRSQESPSGRRNRNALQAEQEAKEFGVDIQSKEAYRAMKKTGEFDCNTWSWLKDLKYQRSNSNALDGHSHEAAVYIYGDIAGYRDLNGGWRASLRVKKV